MFIKYYLLLRDVPYTFHLTLSHMQTTFENTVTKGEIAQNKQFLLLLQCFQLDSVIILSFIKICNIFANMFSKLSAADLLYVGKG